MSVPKVKRTYGSRQNRNPLSSPSSSLSSSPAAPARKRPFDESLNISTDVQPAPKRAKAMEKPKTKILEKKQKKFTQLHFCIDQTILRTCPLCGLSYTKGALDDDVLHRAHCSRVQRGMEWGREEEKEMMKSGVVEVRSAVRLKDGNKGRIICFRADIGGKIGSKLTTLLETINLTLSSPPLMPPVLRASKIYLFLLPPPKSTSVSGREKIAGCVIAQRISTAMQIASPDECLPTHPTSSSSDDIQPPPTPPTSTLVAIDTSTGLFCRPAPLPTPLGIPRIFVPSTYRRRGIASQLLSAAAETFIHGCPLDPRKGQIAFTQPTGDGSAVMLRWGGGGMRIYEE